jgi:hypothetical protein
MNTHHPCTTESLDENTNITTLPLDVIHQGKLIPLKGNPMLRALVWTNVHSSSQ